jgi:hypothetical protein
MSILNRGRTLALGRRSRTEISGELLEQVKLNDISGGRLIGRSCSMKKFRHLILIFLLISQARAGDQRSVNQPTEPGKFFREFAGLSDEQIQDVRSGKAIAKVLQSSVPDEVFVFGAVYINSTPERYLKLVADVDALRKVPSYIALQKFSDPPQIADLDGFVLDEKDLNDLQHCKPGQCEVQLPTQAMEEFQRSVNWTAPDRATQANRLAQQMALQALLRYQQGGNIALGTYRDKSHPTAVAETFALLLNQMKALPVYLPELQRYLLEYPNAKSNEIRSEFYWEKVNFGLKPTLRIVQAILYQGTSLDEPAYAVAVKQLYASHYFETALDLTVCVRDAAEERNGFYLITIKGSQQAGLTGFKGGIVRKVALDKTRSSLEKVLASYKQQLEAKRE